MPSTTNVGLPAFGSGLAFRFSRALVLFALWLAVIGFAPLARAVTFTSNVTISGGDTTYDGQDIIVDGATATIIGARSFISLALTTGAVFTVSPCTATATHNPETTRSWQVSPACKRSGKG